MSESVTEQSDFLSQEDVEKRLDWVRSVVGRLTKRLNLPLSEFDELVSAGYLGYVEAASRFNPECGKKFEHYAVLRVRGAIIDAIRKNCHLSPRAYRYMKALEAVQDLRENGETTNQEKQEPMSRVLGMVAEGALAFQMSMDDIERCDEPVCPAQNAEEQLTEKQSRKSLREKVKHLNDEERRVVTGYYFDERSFASIAAEQGVSKSWISKVHKRALKKLGQSVANDVI